MQCCASRRPLEASSLHLHDIGDGFMVVFDGVEDNISELKCCFEFDEFKTLLARQDFSFSYEATSGVQGPS